MEHLLENQREHIEALRSFYVEVNRRSDHQYSLNDVVIAWFTEGHAENYRQEQIEKRALLVS